MFELIRLLLLPAIAVGAWFLSRSRPELARSLSRGLCVVLLIVLAALAITGYLHPSETFASAHRWSGHSLVIIAWVGVPFGIGVGLQQHGHDPAVAAFLTLGLIALLGVVVIASISGYSGATHVEGITEESLNRFKVLHLGFFPAIIAALLAGWLWLLRSRNDAD
jgi:hypothetical protein